MIRFLCRFLVIASCVGPSVADEPNSGLALHFEASGATDVRHARSVALFVPSGAPATPFLAPGPFKARWEGTLVLEKRSRLIFTLEGTGSARLRIDDELLVGEMGASSESKRLSSGEHRFVCEYESPAEGDAWVRLFWEERDFAREPMPASAFACDPTQPFLAKQQLLRRGREIVAERRCVACHRPDGELEMPELRLAAPSLDDAGTRLTQAWLARWIVDPKAERPAAHMPALFGEDAASKAADIAAYLVGAAPADSAASPSAAAQVKTGGRLFHDQGCISCHVLDGPGDEARISLHRVGEKYRSGALASFLREPTKFHEASRMPDFQFSESEATALEGFLRSLSDAPIAEAPPGDAEKGRQWFASSGCLDCHARGDEKSALSVGQKLADLKSAECAAARFDLSESDRLAVEAFLASGQAESSLARSVAAEFAGRQFEALRCNACHSRDGAQPLREKFAAEVAHLAPPAPASGEEKPALKAGPPPLDHLGLKLRPEWRTRLFAGEIEPKVRPWLAARMPAFPARAEILSAGFSHVAGLPAYCPESPPVDPDKVTVGEAMTGLTGLSCATCHAVGDKAAIAVFEAEGPNLSRAAGRIRPEYFRLWMNDPPRVWPGTIMPKYAVDGRTPLTQHYDGDAARQFDAIYEYLRSLSEN